MPCTMMNASTISRWLSYDTRMPFTREWDEWLELNLWISHSLCITRWEFWEFSTRKVASDASAVRRIFECGKVKHIIFEFATITSWLFHVKWRNFLQRWRRQRIEVRCQLRHFSNWHCISSHVGRCETKCYLFSISDWCRQLARLSVQCNGSVCMGIRGFPTKVHY